MNEIRALILCGGKSSRMGTDKSALLTDGIPFFEKLSREIEGLGIAVVLSCRADQEHIKKSGRTFLIDNSGAEGPMKGLDTAFKSAPDISWLVIPVDMILIDSGLLSFLLKNRDPAFSATVFDIETREGDSFPVPFPGIYEPSFFKNIEEKIKSGRFSVRRAILDSNAKMLSCPEPEKMVNINSPEDLEKVKI